MNYLTPASQTEQRLELLLELTKIDSCTIQSALLDHLVRGMTKADAAKLNGTTQANLQRALDRMEQVARAVEQIKELDWDKFRKEVA